MLKSFSYIVIYRLIVGKYNIVMPEGEKKVLKGNSSLEDI